MNPVRLYGDPFGEHAAARALRSFLRLCTSHGFLARLSLPQPAVAPVGVTAHAVQLTDGVRTFAVPTQLPPEEVGPLVTALQQPVPDTAPVVVFARRSEWIWRSTEVGLLWPRACKVLAGNDGGLELLGRLRAELRWAGTEDPGFCGDGASLRPWFAVGGPMPGGPILHVGSDDPGAGSDLAVRAFASGFAASGRRLRVVLPPGQEDAVRTLSRLAAEAAPAGTDAAAAIDFVLAEPAPAHVAGAAAVLQPMRTLRDGQLLARLLATGVPVVATRFSATAPFFADGAAFPVGGRLLPAEASAPARCEAYPRSIAAALGAALADPVAAAAVGVRARQHVVAALQADRPAAPPLPAGPLPDRPVVVLEAPFLEVSSASGLSIDTARALLRRGNVELRLLPRAPFRCGLEAFAARWPQLVPLLEGAPRDVDLWLAAGWPPRAVRPPCRSFAVRFDWEYGSLPLELSPLLTQEVDTVVVHSTHVHRTMATAGVPPERMVVIPHGVDGDTFHDQVEPLAEIVDWKRSLPAVLFVGGLIYRKGIDVFLRAALAAHAAGHRFAVVVKGIGSDQHYAGHHLRALVERFSRTNGAPPLLLIERELTRGEMAGLYRACDLLVHPYRGEGFGLPVLEARAVGLPVLVTKGGATDDFALGPGVLGLPAARRDAALPQPCAATPWLLEPDAEAAGHVLGSAIGDLAALGRSARRMAPVVREQFTWDHAAAAIEQLANIAAGRRRAGGRLPRIPTAVR